MPLPLRLTAIVQPPIGPERRFALDAPAAGDRPLDLTFSDTVPGGFEQCDFSLIRDALAANLDLKDFTNVRIEGPGRQLAWEGRIEGAGKTTDRTQEVAPSLVGWQAALADDETATPVYIDKSLDNWQPATSTRKKTTYAFGFDVQSDLSSDSDQTTGKPALVLDGDGEWLTGRICEGLYDSHGLLESIYFAYAHRNFASAAWTAQVYGANDADATSGVVGGADLITGTSTATTYTTGTWTETAVAGKRFAHASLNYAGVMATDTDRDVRLSDVAVVGRTGLTLRGTHPAAGFYASDIIEHAIRTYASVLGRSIDPTSWIIQQAAFLDGTSAAEIVRFANAYHLYDWGVWDNKVFHYYERGNRGRRWRARVGNSNLQDAGPQVDKEWNGVVVVYQDVDGTTRSVGPVGSSADYTTATLQNSDPANSANASNLRRWTRLDLGVTRTQAGAVEIGRRFLIEASQLNRAGSAALQGYVMDELGVLRPAWQVRAGDLISFIDASDTSYRRIVRKTYSHSDYTASIDLDSPPEGLDALLERISGEISPLGIS